jgi:hypothetical protein
MPQVARTWPAVLRDADMGMEMLVGWRIDYRKGERV